MLRLAPMRATIGAALLFAAGFGGCSCQEVAESLVQLAFVSPNPGAQLTSADDLDPRVVGVQVAVTLKTTGVVDPSTASVQLVNSSDVDASPLTASVDADGNVAFPSVTMVDGNNRLVATLSHSGGTDVVTEVAYSVSSDSGNVCRFVAPENGIALVDGLVIGADADEDARQAGVQMPVAVQCVGEAMADGVLVGLNVEGAAAALDATLDGGVALFPSVTLPEGEARLVTYAVLGGQQAGTATVQFTVDTGRCDVRVDTPANGEVILALNDADPETPTVADVDVVVTSTRCGLGTQVDVLVDGGEPASGMLNADGTATVRIELPQSEDGNDQQGFVVVLTDPEGDFRQGSSLQHRHIVDTIAPDLRAVDLAEDEATILTAADDIDDNPVDELTFALRVRVTNGDDVASLRVVVDGDEAWAVSGSPNELGIFSTELRLAAGDHTIAVDAADAYGNSARIEHAVIVDITVPVVTLVQPAQSGTVLAAADADPDSPGFQLDCSVSVANFSTISGVAPRVYCELQNLDEQGNAVGPWVASEFMALEGAAGDTGVGVVRLTLPDGNWNIRAGAVTRAGLGNRAIPSDPRNLRVDGTPPSIEFVHPVDGEALRTADGAIELAVSGAEEGRVVTLTAGGNRLDPSPVVDAFGRARYDGAPWAAGDGPITLVAEVSDSAGNPAPEASIDVVIDGEAPQIALFGVAGGVDGAARDLVANGEIDAEADPALDWGGGLENGLQYGLRVVVANEAVGQTVQLRLNGELLSAATVDAGGERQANFFNDGNGLNLLERDNSIAINVTDGAGNTSALNAVVVVNTGQPYIRLVSPQAGSHSSSGVAVVSAQTNADPGTQCQLTAQTAGQADVTANAAVDQQGALDFGIQRMTAEGTWTLQVVCPLPGGGNVSSEPGHFIVDMTPPVLSFVGLPQIGEAVVFNASNHPDGTAGGRYRRHLTVSAASDGACTVAAVVAEAQLTVAGGAVDVAGVPSDRFTPGDDCSFRFDSVALADEVLDPNSSVVVTVTANDMAGNQGQAEVTIIVDRQGPVITITDPQANALLSTDEDEDLLQDGLQYSVAATIEGGDMDQEAALLDNGAVLVSVPASQVRPNFPAVTIQDGVHSLAVRASDEHGNVSLSPAISVTTDSSAPTLNIFRPYSEQVFGLAGDSNPQLAGFQIDMIIEVTGVNQGAVVNVDNEQGQLIGTGNVQGPTALLTSVPLNEGTQTITASTSDGINEASDSTVVTVDLTPPTASDCDFPGDDGVSIGGFLAFSAAEDGNVGPAGWQGQCRTTVAGVDEGASVQVLSNNPAPGTVVGTAVVNLGGATDVDLSLADGLHILTMSVRDGAGNTNQPGAGRAVRVDTTPPAPVISAPADNDLLLAVDDSNEQEDGLQTVVRVSTGAEEGTSVEVLAGEQVLGTGLVVGGLASVNVSLPEGASSITARSTDQVGNQGVSGAVRVVVDSIAPVVAITSPAGGEVYGDEHDDDRDAAGFQKDIVVTTSQVEVGQTLVVRSSVGGQRCSAPVTGQPLTLRCTLLEGADQGLIAEVADTSGNLGSSAAVTVSIDLTAPTLVFTSPAQNPAYLNAGDDADLGADDLQYTFVLQSDADGQQVTLRRGQQQLGAAVVANGAASIGPLTLAEGQHNLSASVNSGGNTTVINLEANVDITAPTLTLVSPAANPATYTAADDLQAGAPLDATFAFTVAGAVGGSLTGSSDQQANLPTEAVLADGAMQLSGATLDNGLTHNLTFTLTDRAGNEATQTLQAVVDVVAPDAIDLTATVRNNHDGTVRLNWTEPGDDGAAGIVAGYQVRYATIGINEDNFATATQVSEAINPVGGGTPMQVDITNLPFDEPAVRIAARAVDDLGNQSELSQDSVVTVSTAWDTHTYSPPAPTAYFGWKKCHGDFNGDGYGDLAITDRSYGPGGPGGVHIYFGSNNPAAMTTQTIVGGQGGGRFGVSCAVGNFNGDAFDDLVIGAAWEGAGNVYVFNGGQAGVSGTPSATIAGASGNFGYAVSAFGSLTGDETPDLVVTAYRFGSTAGRAYVFDGTGLSGNLTVADAVATVDGRSLSKTGIAMVAGYDVTGDGNGDIVLGASIANNNDGEIVVAAGPFAAGDALTIDSPRVQVLQDDLVNSWQLGRFVTVGDLDGDGVHEVIGSFNEGTRVLLVWRGQAQLSATADLTLPMPAGSVGSREIMEDGSCDINGDGRWELFAGSTNEVFVWRGAASLNQVSSQPDRIYDVGTGDWDTITCAGDLNGDQKADTVLVVRGGSGTIQVRY